QGRPRICVLDLDLLLDCHPVGIASPAIVSVLSDPTAMSQTATITRPATALSVGGKSNSPSSPMAAEGIELQRMGTGQSVGKDMTRVGSTPQDPRRTSSEEVGDADGAGPPPGHVAHGEVQRWNHPRGNVPKLAFAFLSFIIAGLNDAAVGALIPYLEQYYDLNYTIVSLVFLTPFAGYSVAAFTNARIHMKYGQRGVAVMAPLCHIITYAVVATHPPFPVIVVIYAISGFGNGLTDACYCAWVGDMDKANQVQGFMHACYSLGLTITFWHKTGAVYRAEHPRQDGAKGAGTKDALKSKVTWMCALFFFTYMGVEVGLGGWVVTFMLRVRDAGAYASGISGSGFWAGMVAGRAGLGFVTERFGERLCISIYLVCCIALQLLFWLVPRFEVSAVAVAFLGFFLGPMFPGAVTVTAKLLPKDIHVSAIGFAMAMGGTGGTVFPFAIGAIAAKRGLLVLQPIILALIVVVAGVWLAFPRIKKRQT
ncbi:hypothetical protein BN1708_013447, partial [Verticillium longisporum]